jgi:hypothetical protein
MAGTVPCLDPVKVRSRGLQVSLGGLVALVLAAGVAAGAARSAREVWGLRTLVNPGAPGVAWSSGTGSVPIERTAGVVLEVAAVFLLVILARNLIGVFRSARPNDGQDREIRLWGIAWRVGAICFLLWFISEESRVLRVTFATEVEISELVPGWGVKYRAHQQLYPACGLFAMLGLVVGTGAGILFPRAPQGGRRPYWLFVILAGAVAVLIPALDELGSLIAQLVLIALEAVTYAMRHRLNPGRALSTRLLHAGLDAAVAAGLCLGLALAVARDFEMLRQGKAWAGNFAGWAFRLLLLAGAAVAGIFIAAVTIPAIHPSFAEGFVQILGPVEAGMVVCCFGLFGAGMAARAIVVAQGPRPSVGSTRISALYRLAILGIVLFAVLNAMPDASRLVPYAPRFFTSTVAFIHGGLSTLWDRFPDSFTATMLRTFSIENILWISLILAVLCFVIELLIRDKSTLSSPFDRIAESPERVRRFIWLVSGFVVVCLAALPILIVAGQVVVLLRLVGVEMFGEHWAN